MVYNDFEKHVTFIANFPGETVCNDYVPASGEQRNCSSVLRGLSALHQAPDEEDSLVLLKLPLLFILGLSG